MEPIDFRRFSYPLEGMLEYRTSQSLSIYNLNVSISAIHVVGLSLRYINMPLIQLI